MGIEPTPSAWQAEILTVKLYLHIAVFKDTAKLLTVKRHLASGNS